MSSFLYKILISLVLAVTFTACSPKHEKGLPEIDSATDKSISGLLESPQRIVWTDVKATLIQPRCFNCHSSSEKKGNVVLENLDSMMGKGGTKAVIRPGTPEDSPLYTSLLAPRMPPANSNRKALNENEVSVIYQWIKNGAKVKVDDLVTPTVSLKKELAPYFASPETIDYKVVNKYVFSHACNSCHSKKIAVEDTDAWSYGADLTDYKSTTDQTSIFPPQALVIGRPNESRVYQSTAHTQRMPPSKEGYDPLNAFRAKILRLWILNCAIEDIDKLSALGDPLLESAVTLKLEKIRDCKKLDELLNPKPLDEDTKKTAGTALVMPKFSAP